MGKFKYIDLFAGCGGLSYGFQNNKYFKHLLATDFWEPAKVTYEQNFPGSKYFIADLSKEEDYKSLIQNVTEAPDLIVGGPPCKGFSTLNNSKKESHHNTLVDVYLDVVVDLNPKMFLIENVRGFTSKKHPSGTTYPQHIISRIENINAGYHYRELILNAKDYGTAQNRIRYFFLAVRKDFDPEAILIDLIESSILSQKEEKAMTLRDAIGDLPKVPVRGGANEILKGNGDILFNHKSMNHSPKLEERLRYVPQGGGVKDVPKELLTDHLRRMVDGEYGSGGFAKNIYGRMEWNKPSGTIVAGMDKITCGRFVHPEENRLLTPRECARIQTFPDNFIFKGGMVTQYYLVGNAVPPRISEVFANAFSIALRKKGEKKGEELVCS